MQLFESSLQLNSRRFTMMALCRALAVPLLIISVASCNPPKKLAKPQYRLMDTIVVSARNNPMEIYRATAPRVWDIVHTEVSLRFDFFKKEASGKAKLSVQPYNFPADTLVLDAKGMLIHSVNIQAGSVHWRGAYTYDSSQLKIVMKNVFAGADHPRTALVDIEYTAQPYATQAGGSKAITEDRGLYFINTDGAIPGKPMQIWTQGETESNSHWLPTIDKPNQRTTIDLKLVVPDSMQTLSNGYLANSIKHDNRMRADHWRMEQPIQVYGIMFAIGRFDIAKDNWKDPQGKLREVSYYTEPAFAPYARTMFKNTPEMMSFFSRATGIPYPWNKYSQVVVRDYVSGAMENTSASLFGEFMNQNSRQLLDAGTEDVVAHELFHQWFGDYVTAESWSNLTLNESFATYGQVLWRKYKYGKSSADELAYEDLQRYLSSTGRGVDPPLVRFYYRDKEEMFDRVSYQKGAAILRYINSITGDTLFSKAMQIYLSRHALHAAEASDWRKALEEATGQDWTQFFNEWYYRGGHPVLKVRYNYDDQQKKVTVTIRQVPFPDSSKLYHLRFKTAIIYTDHQETVEWVISNRTQTYTYTYPSVNGCNPAIIPDVEHVLPVHMIEEGKGGCYWMTQIEHSDSADYVSKRLAIDAAMADQVTGAANETLKRGLRDQLSSVRMYTLQQLQELKKPVWQTEITPMVAYMLETESANKVRAAAFALLGIWKVRAQLPALVAAIQDSSYQVAGAALAALRLMDADSAYTIAQGMKGTDPKGSLQEAVWTAIVTKGNPAEIITFEAKAPSMYGTVKTAFAGNLQRYARAVKDDTVYERTLKLLLSLTRTESIRVYRYAIGSNVFALNKTYSQEVLKKGKGVAQAQERLKITERYTKLILAEESDTINIKQYKESLR